jgi:hypothetical protein
MVRERDQGPCRKDTGVMILSLALAALAVQNMIIATMHPILTIAVAVAYYVLTFPPDRPAETP